MIQNYMKLFCSFLPFKNWLFENVFHIMVCPFYVFIRFLWAYTQNIHLLQVAKINLILVKFLRLIKQVFIFPIMKNWLIIFKNLQNLKAER